MDFEPSDDQRLLVESVTRMLGDTYNFAQRKGYMALPEGYSPAIWSQFAEQGLLGLPFAEEYGGFGGSAQEVMLVMQAFGRVLVLEPYFPTVVLAGTALNVAGSAAQKAALLPAIAEGSLKLAFAHSERQARYDLTDVVTTAKKNGSGWVLDGSKTVVSHGEAADKLVVSARTGGDRYDADGITLFLVDAGASGVARRGYVSRDDTRAADISLSNVAVSEADVLGPVGGGRGDRWRDGSDERNDAGVQQDPRAVRQPDRHVPSGAAPAGGYVHGAGAGPQHGDAGDDVDRQSGRREAGA